MNPARRSSRIVFALYPLVVFALGSVFILPNLVHLLEFRPRRSIDLAALETRGSTDITLRGARLLEEASLAESVTSLRYRTTSTTVFIPLVASSSQPGRIPAILMGSGDRLDAVVKSLRSGQPVELELHDTLWEGTPDELRDRWTEAGLDVSAAVTLMPAGSTPKFGFVMLILFTLAAAAGAFTLASESAPPSVTRRVAQPIEPKPAAQTES